MTETTDSADAIADPTLETVVVRYRDRPDRCTLAPPGDPAGAAWLTAAADAFVDLEDAR